MAGDKHIDVPDEFDALLREALSIEPSPDFLPRVRVRISAEPRSGYWNWHLWLTGAAAAAVCVVAVAVTMMSDGASAPVAPQPSVVQEGRPVVRPAVPNAADVAVSKPSHRHAPVGAQEPAKAGGSQSANAQVPLKVQLVISRYSGEKKVSSVPYTLVVVANDNDKTSLRMGVDLPVPMTVFTGPANNVSAPTTSYQYRSIGTNIDCAARTVEGGLFKLDLGISDTSVFLTDKQAGANANPLAGLPAFRSFTSTFNVLLRDGQTAQHTAATDPVSGEVLRVDVTLSVLK